MYPSDPSFGGGTLRLTAVLARAACPIDASTPVLDARIPAQHQRFVKFRPQDVIAADDCGSPTAGEAIVELRHRRVVSSENTASQGRPRSSDPGSWDDGKTDEPGIDVE